MSASQMRKEVVQNLQGKVIEILEDPEAGQFFPILPCMHACVMVYKGYCLEGRAEEPADPTDVAAFRMQFVKWASLLNNCSFSQGPLYTCTYILLRWALDLLALRWQSMLP